MNDPKPTSARAKELSAWLRIVAEWRDVFPFNETMMLCEAANILEGSGEGRKVSATTRDWVEKEWIQACNYMQKGSVPERYEKAADKNFKVLSELRQLLCVLSEEGGTEIQIPNTSEPKS